MAIRAVNRQIEIEKQPIPQAPGYSQVFARWVGETAFTHAMMTDAMADLMVTDLVDPRELKNELFFMPHAKRPKMPSWQKKKDFRGMLYALSPAAMTAYRDTGYPFHNDIKNPAFEARKWLEAVPADFEVVVWCFYDHSMMDLQGEFVVGSSISLITSSSHNLSKLRKFVAASDGKFSWAEEDHYVRGNGLSNSIRTRYTPEEFRELKMTGASGSNFWEVCRVLGIDYQQFAADERDNDGDDDDL